MLDIIGEGGIIGIISAGKKSPLVVKKTLALESIFDKDAMKDFKKNWSAEMNFARWIRITEKSPDQNDAKYMKALYPYLRDELKTANGGINKEYLNELLDKQSKKKSIFKK